MTKNSLTWLPSTLHAPNSLVCTLGLSFEFHGTVLEFCNGRLAPRSLSTPEPLRTLKEASWFPLPAMATQGVSWPRSLGTLTLSGTHICGLLQGVPLWEISL